MQLQVSWSAQQITIEEKCQYEVQLAYLLRMKVEANM